MVSFSSIEETVLIYFIMIILLHFKTGVGQKQVFKPDGEPSDTSVIENSNVILKCRISNVDGIVQWAKDGFALGFDRNLRTWPRYSMNGDESLGEFDLLILNAQLEDDNSYDCQAGATADNVPIKSKVGKLTVLIPPKEIQIEKGLSQVEIKEGTSYNISCTAKGGRHAPVITWSSSRDLTEYPSINEEVESKGKINDVTAYYEVKPRRENNGDFYMCHIRNDAMTSSAVRKVKLSVLYKPQIKMNVIPSMKIREGSDVMFTCEARANPQHVSWKWYENNVYRNLSSNSFVIKSIGWIYDGMNISCTGENSMGTAYQSQKLEVFYAPFIIPPEMPISVDSGKIVEMSCDAKGNPKPTIKWYMPDKKAAISHESTLLVTSASTSNLRSYICEASSTGFKSVEQTYYIVENGPPKTDQTADIQYGSLNAKAFLLCVVDGIPRVNDISWHHNGEIIQSYDSEKFYIQHENTLLGINSTLRILNAQEDDFGLYTCFASNQFGEAIAEIYFTEDDSSVQLHVILGAVFGTLLVILLILLATVWFCRYKYFLRSDSSTTSDNSECQLNKSDSFNRPDCQVQYISSYSNPMMNTYTAKPAQGILNQRLAEASRKQSPRLVTKTSKERMHVTFPEHDKKDESNKADIKISKEHKKAPYNDYSNIPDTSYNADRYMESNLNEVIPPPTNFSDSNVISNSNVNSIKNHSTNSFTNQTNPSKISNTNSRPMHSYSNATNSQFNRTPTHGSHHRPRSRLSVVLEDMDNIV